MTAIAGAEPIPPLYAKWADAMLGGLPPRESAATCDVCAMCAKAGEDTATLSYFFDPAVKCCTYLPNLHNFLAGRILTGGDPAEAAGRATVEARLASRIGVTPLGLGQSPVFVALYHGSKDAFGKARSVRCPHFIEDGARCGVWKNRNSVCTTWFCKHVRGDVGKSFWRALQHALESAEKELARWCVLELELGDDALARLTASLWSGSPAPLTSDALDGKADPKVYKALWGAWFGREREFFQRCQERVDALSWLEILSICGPDLRAQAKLARVAFAKLTADEISPALKVGPFQIVKMDRGTTRVSTYSVYDPLDMPATLMEVLPYFDGRPTDAALAAIEADLQIRIEPALLRKMQDFKLLVPAGEDVPELR